MLCLKSLVVLLMGEHLSSKIFPFATSLRQLTYIQHLVRQRFALLILQSRLVINSCFKRELIAGSCASEYLLIA